MLSEVLDGQIPQCADLCGPPAMVEDAAKALAELGVDAPGCAQRSTTDDRAAL